MGFFQEIHTQAALSDTAADRKRQLIMQDGLVHEGAYIENCIMDKQSVIKRGAKLIGPAAYPIVIAKNVVI